MSYLNLLTLGTRYEVDVAMGLKISNMIACKKLPVPVAGTPQNAYRTCMCKLNGSPMAHVSSNARSC